MKKAMRMRRLTFNSDMHILEVWYKISSVDIGELSQVKLNIDLRIRTNENFPKKPENIEAYKRRK